MTATPSAVSEAKGRQGRAAPSAQARALRRVMRTPVTVVGAVLVVLLILFAFSGPILHTVDPNVMDGAALRMPPGTPGHPLGTDTFGRDLLSRSVAGAKVSLVISLTVVFLSVGIGALMGAVAGYAGGATDSLICRAWDMLSVFPGLVLYLVIVSSLGRGIPMLIIAMTVGGIPLPGRLMRERVLAQRNTQYVEAANSLGASPARILFKHVIPNCLTPLLVTAALNIPGVIGGEAAMSYLGLGVQMPTASWGQMIADGQAVLETAPWIALIGGAFILLATLGFNLVGDGLRDYFDPTQLR